MKENWGNKGMPPVIVDVKHAYTAYDKDTVNGYHIEEKRYWIGGSHVHYGKPRWGWSGQETEVKKETITSPKKEVRIKYL